MIHTLVITLVNNNNNNNNNNSSKFKKMNNRKRIVTKVRKTNTKSNLIKSNHRSSHITQGSKNQQIQLRAMFSQCPKAPLNNTQYLIDHYSQRQEQNQNNQDHDSLEYSYGSMFDLMSSSSGNALFSSASPALCPSLSC